MKKLLIRLIIATLVAIIVGFIVLVLYQNLIFLLQKLDYTLYKASNQPAQILAELQNQATTNAVANNTNNAQQISTFLATTSTIGPILTNQANTTIASTPRPTKKLQEKNKPQWITIPKIGVNTPILTQGPLKKRMYRGVALITAFGRPDKPNKSGKVPVILASHRFGYVWWTPAYRRTNSFHNIDKLAPKDIIYIRWKGIWYKYAVTKKEISATISEYYHDLILYSCISYTSKKRIIIYADRL